MNYDNELSGSWDTLLQVVGGLINGGTTLYNEFYTKGELFKAQQKNSDAYKRLESEMQQIENKITDYRLKIAELRKKQTANITTTALVAGGAAVAGSLLILAGGRK